MISILSTYKNNQNLLNQMAKMGCIASVQISAFVALSNSPTPPSWIRDTSGLQTLALQGRNSNRLNLAWPPKKDSRNLDPWASITTYVHGAPSNHILISLSFSWIVHILPLMPLNPGYVQPELTWVAHQTGSVCFCSSTPNFVPAGLFFWFISMPSSVMEQGN